MSQASGNRRKEKVGSTANEKKIGNGFKLKQEL